MKNELGLTVSIGISFNKIFAKLGSDMKKPDAITSIEESEWKQKVWPLRVSELLFCGRSTTKKLEQVGIYTIGDLAKIDHDYVNQLLGKNGLMLWSYANGLDDSPVMEKDFVSPMKSVGHGITCTADLKTEEEVWKVILELCQDIGHRLRIHMRIIVHNSVGVKRTLYRNTFHGYLQEKGHIGKTIEQDKIVILLKACANCRDQILLLLLAETGFRIGELLGVRYATDIDYNRFKCTEYILGVCRVLPKRCRDI